MEGSPEFIDGNALAEAPAPAAPIVAATNLRPGVRPAHSSAATRTDLAPSHCCRRRARQLQISRWCAIEAVMRLRRRGPRPPKPPIILPERLQHGLVVQLAAQIADSAGRPSAPFRAVGLLDVLYHAGKITGPGYDAARQFEADFRIAGYDRLRAGDVGRAPVHGARPAELTSAAIRARQRIDATLAPLPPMQRSALWHVIGLGDVLEDWARRQRWAGKAIGSPLATLVAAIEALAQPPRGREAAE